jgi:hydroxyacylglutathione hydrolase
VFLKRFFEPSLAQTSYLIGCAAAREALIIDPHRDVDVYIREAEAEGLRIAHVTETHIHADFVSGTRELAARTGATVYVSDEGGPDWTYAFADEPGVRRLKDGATVTMGRVSIQAVHTPGHTPEHLTFLVTDGAAASEPIGAATGDFIFVGDVGRPDLLERAAHIAGTMESSAGALYRSLRAFAARPDWLQIWPGHGAGSACGKGISAIPHSTLGYERRFNWAFQVTDEADFVTQVLAGQPEPPTYFAAMKRINRAGPPIVGSHPRPGQLGTAELERRLAEGAIVIDTRPAGEYAVGHVTGTINIPLEHTFSTWAGWLVPVDAEVTLIVDERRGPGIASAVRSLSLIGIDRVLWYFDADVLDDWAAGGRPLGVIPQLSAADLRESLVHGGVTLVDVRGRTEWVQGHIFGARHVPLGHLGERIAELPAGKPVVVQCGAGSRSAIAASLLRARGVHRVINLSGGISAWIAAGLPTVAGE